MSVICRTCLQDTHKDSFYYLDTFDNREMTNTVPKEVLQICIPELDLYISNHPGVCGPCLKMFESFYSFKNRCLAAEDTILKYLEKYRVNPQSKVELGYVVHDICDISDERLLDPLPMVLENNIEQDIEGVFKLNDKTDEVVVINLSKHTSPNTTTTATPTVEDPNILLYCNKCSFVTMNTDNLANHNCVAVMTTDKYKCPYCDYSTSRRERINRHVQAKHSRNSQYACEQCDFCAPSALILRRHKREVHPQTIIRIFECNLCPYTASSGIELQRHKLCDHQAPIQYCNVCPYQTKDKSNFRKHMYTHNEKPIQCSKCNYECVSPYQLTKHYKKFH